MAFAERILGQIVRGDGSLAAHLHHCPYIAIGTKNHIPAPSATVSIQSGILTRLETDPRPLLRLKALLSLASSS
jgi:hypothetical protein